jgi:hypothetical protein
VQDKALCLVFRRYIWAGAGTTLSSFTIYSSFDYLPTFFHSQKHDHLYHAIQCLGKLGIARETNSPQVLAGANTEYASALHLTNAALEKIDEARSDRLLVTVMLLGLFEVLPKLLPASHCS